MSHVISWLNKGGHGFCLKTVFLLGSYPFPGVAAEEMYICWFCKYAQNSLFSSRSDIARRKQSEMLFSSLSISSKRRPEAASICTLWRKVFPLSVLGVEGKEGQSTVHLHSTSHSSAVVCRENALQTPCAAWVLLGHAGARNCLSLVLPGFIFWHFLPLPISDTLSNTSREHQHLCCYWCRTCCF